MVSQCFWCRDLFFAWVLHHAFTKQAGGEADIDDFPHEGLEWRGILVVKVLKRVWSAKDQALNARPAAVPNILPLTLPGGPSNTHLGETDAVNSIVKCAFSFTCVKSILPQVKRCLFLFGMLTGSGRV